MKWFNSNNTLPASEEKVLVSANGVYMVCSFDANLNLFKSSEDTYPPANSTYWTPFTDEHLNYETHSQQERKKTQYLHSFLTQIIDSSEDVILALDHELNFLIVNAAYEKYMQRKREDIVGKSLFEINPVARGTTQHDYMLRALNGESLRLEPTAGIGRPEFSVETQFTPLVIEGKVEGVMVRSRIIDQI